MVTSAMYLLKVTILTYEPCAKGAKASETVLDARWDDIFYWIAINFERYVSPEASSIIPGSRRM